MKAKEENLYFYKLIAADFLAEVFKIPDGCHKSWVAQLALDLVSGEGNTAYSQKLIKEAENYRNNKSRAGKAGMANRYKKEGKVLTLL